LIRLGGIADVAQFQLGGIEQQLKLIVQMRSGNCCSYCRFFFFANLLL
jgi:hypothetical protein